MSNKLRTTCAAKLLSELYLDDEFADFNFTFQGEKVPVHKNILAKGSKVFRAQFYGGVKDKDSVEIFDSNANAFKIFLQFFYLDEVTLTMEHIEEVVKLADKYDMLDCVNTCVEFLVGQLTDKNTIWGYQLAISLENQVLKQFCEKRISLNTKNVMKSEDFRRCDPKTLESILKLDEMTCDEVDVFNACVSWAKYAAHRNGMDKNCVENLRTQLGDCFYFIRFAAMKAEEFAGCTKDYKNLFTREEIVDIMYSTIIEDVKPTIFSQMPRISLDPNKWNGTEKLSCSRLYYGNRIVEVFNMQFSLNVRALLGEIHCVPLCDGYRNSITRCFDMKITEINKAGTNKKVIFAGNFQTLVAQTVQIPLSKALIINPESTYEVNLETKGGGGIFSMYHPWKTEYNLDDQLVVKFISGSTSLISCLTFKRL